MKKIILVGRSGAGKTTLTQALKGNEIVYHKTQYVEHGDVIIDTPGEYAENKKLSRALLLYSFEADVVGILMSATDQYSLYSPNIVSLSTRPVIGIVTQTDKPGARVHMADMWLRLTGCQDIFHISAVTGEGIPELWNYLCEDKNEKEAKL